MYSCYAQYSIATMDTDDYGLCHPETGKRDGPNNTRVNCSLIDGYPYADSGSGFTWTSAKENFGVPFAPDLDMQVDGMLGSYDGSGFVRDIKPAPDQYAVAPETFDDAIAELKDYLWFDQRTRAAMISFAVYNGNYDMFMSVQFLFEITQAGLVLPQYKFKSLSLDHPWGKLTEAEVSKVVDKDPTTTRLTSSKDGLLYIEGVMYLLVFSFLIRELVDALRVRIKCGTRLGRGRLTHTRAPPRSRLTHPPALSSSSLCTNRYKTFRYYFNVWAIIEDMNIAFFISGLVIRIMLMFQPTRLNFYMFAREYQELGPVASLYALGRFSDSAAGVTHGPTPPPPHPAPPSTTTGTT